MTAVSVIAVVVAGLLAVPLVQRWVPTAGGSTGADRAAAGSSGSAAKLAPVAGDERFTGTPAEEYARGAAGIVLPRPVQVGAWSSADVAKILRRTRDVLVTARLDPRTVEKGNLAPYLQLLAPATRPMVRKQIVAGGPAIGYVTRLAPGYTLDPEAAVRVAGTMSVRAGKDGQLVVAADYVWVYPVKGGKPLTGNGAGSTLVLLRASESYEWYRPEAIGVADRGLRPGVGSVYTWNVNCALVTKGLLALPVPGPTNRPADRAAYNPRTKPGSVPSTC